MPERLPDLYCDIDGVLAFQPEGSILAVNGRFGTSYLAAEATAYPWASTIPRHQQEWVHASRAVIAANLAPDTEAVTVLRKAGKAGYRVIICTERGQALDAVTRAWLASWQVPSDAVAVVEPGGKGPLIAAGGGEAILIDDSPANEAIAADGVQVWVPPRPWTPRGDPPDRVWRFGSWREAKKKLGL